MVDVQMLLKIDEELHASIKAESEKQQRSFAGQVRFILNQYFSTYEVSEKKIVDKFKDEIDKDILKDIIKLARDEK